MNLQNGIERPYLLLKVFLCPISWIGRIPAKVSSCADGVENLRESLVAIITSTRVIAKWRLIRRRECGQCRSKKVIRVDSDEPKIGPPVPNFSISTHSFYMNMYYFYTAVTTT